MDDYKKEAAARIREIDDSFAIMLLEKQYQLQPEMKMKYGEKQVRHYLEDTKYHLMYLAESIANGEPVLFNEYLGWAKVFFVDLSVTDDEIIKNLELMRDNFEEIFSPDISSITTSYINEGIEFYKKKPQRLPSFFNNDNPLKETAIDYLNYLIEGNKRGALELIMNEVERGTAIKNIYLNIFQVTQKETGRLWQMGKISVAQEHFITAATQLIMSQLYPYLFTTPNKKQSIIVSCINGELHEIGARMVADLFEMDGWNSYYYGANTPQNSLINAIETYKPDILAISATMTYNINAVSELIRQVKNDSKFKKTKILVGGYPFLLADKMWQNVGADGFAVNVPEAINLANQLINQS